MAKYIPPRNFNAVLNNIYRSSIPTELNFPFLERLKLKTIVYLSSLPIPESLHSFCQDVGIVIKQITCTECESNDYCDVDETMVVNALKSILDVTNLPLLITAEEGSIKTGIVVACLRKKQKWNLSSIFEEYRRYDGLKANLDDEQFIELFDPDLVSMDIDECNMLK